jgi:hypothetical protein
MDIGRSFTFMFEDESWITKVLLGGVLGIVPILNFVVYGYQLEVIRNVAQDQELPLPEWGDDFGGKFVRGLMVFIASLIYSLPLIVVWVAMAIVLAIAGGSADASGDAQGAAGAFVGICTFAVYCVAIIYSIIAFGFLFVPGLMRYAEEGEFGAFFRFGENWRVATSNLGSYIVMLLIIIVASIVAQIVGTIACVIGLLFTVFWYVLVTGHLFGQYWKDNEARVQA